MMLNIEFNLSNPFSDRWNLLWGKSGIYSMRKFWELNVYETHNFIELILNFTIKGDHAGLYLMFGLFGYSIEYHVYDNRHWDYEKNTWEIA